MLKDDHKQIRKVFRDFQAAGDGAAVRKGKLVDTMIQLLTQHTYIENEVMYPGSAPCCPSSRTTCSSPTRSTTSPTSWSWSSRRMKPTDERFDAKTTVLIENVQHHMDEEEQDWFPKVRAGLGRKQLQEIGEEMVAAKKKAPKKPSQPSALKKTVDAVLS